MIRTSNSSHVSLDSLSDYKNAFNAMSISDGAISQTYLSKPSATFYDNYSVDVTDNAIAYKSDELACYLLSKSSSNSAYLRLDLGRIPSGAKIKISFEAKVIEGDSFQISVDYADLIPTTTSKEKTDYLLRNYTDTLNEWQSFELEYIVQQLTTLKRIELVIGYTSSIIGVSAIRFLRIDTDKGNGLLNQSPVTKTDSYLINNVGSSWSTYTSFIQGRVPIISFDYVTQNLSGVDIKHLRLNFEKPINDYLRPNAIAQIQSGKYTCFPVQTQQSNLLLRFYDIKLGTYVNADALTENTWTTVILFSQGSESYGGY